MDIFTPYLFFLLFFLPFSLYLIFFFHKQRSGDAKNLPPGSTGWPILGENVELAWSGMSKFVSDRMRRYSPDVFRTSLLGETMMVFCGAQGNKLVFSGEGKLVTPWLPLSLKKVVLPASDNSAGEHIARFRVILHDALKPEFLRQYIPVMDAVSRQHLHRHWNPNSAVQALPLLHRYTFELSCRLFLNVVDEGLLKEIREPFDAVRNGVFSLPVDLPGTAFGRAVKAGKVLRRVLAGIAAEARRKETVAGRDGDMLSGSGILLLTGDDETIARFFVGLLLASYDTTATALVAVVYFLAQLPHVYRGVLQEQMAIAKSKGACESLKWEDVENMKYSWNVSREALRLAPPTAGAFREATGDISYAGFTIYKGTKVFWSPYSTNKNPNYFPDPEKFDPSRFEGSGPTPNTFVPFGGGARMCPGKGYAKLAMLVFMHNLVTSFRFEKVIPDEKLKIKFTPKPTHSLHFRLFPHNTN